MTSSSTSPPFYLKSEYTPGGNLAEWAIAQGGIDKVLLATRLDLVARTADAVAAAHSVGVIHKDIKPSNILIYTDPATGEQRPRLSDFGIGMLADRSTLGSRDITELGFTTMTEANDSSHTLPATLVWFRLPPASHGRSAKRDLGTGCDRRAGFSRHGSVEL